jgi:hypothetical protein
MEPLTQIAAIVGGLVFIVTKVVEVINSFRAAQAEKELNSSEKKLTDLEIALKVASKFVSSAEELGAELGGTDGKKWTGPQKYAYAASKIAQELPGMTPDQMKDLIHAALNLAKLGASAWEESKD